MTAHIEISEFAVLAADMSGKKHVRFFENMRAHRGASGFPVASRNGGHMRKRAADEFEKLRALQNKFSAFPRRL